MNKRIKTSVVLLFLFLQMQAFAQNKKENFVGKWKAPKGDIIIISVLGKSFVGKTNCVSYFSKLKVKIFFIVYKGTSIKTSKLLIGK